MIRPVSAPDGMDLTIRPATVGDLPELDRDLPAAGGWNAIRMSRSLTGSTTLLVAIASGDLPTRCLGRAEVLWTGCAAPNVQLAYPHVPEINGLEVAVLARGRGVGTALVEAGCAHAVERGCDRIGLGVAVENVAARCLYERLGFTGDVDYLDRYAIVTDGVEHGFADPCHFLVRDL